MKLYSDDAKGIALKVRDELLARSDWTQFNDSPLSDEDKAIWATYRQALRDYPSQEGFPNIKLPEQPELNPIDYSDYVDSNGGE